MSKLTDDIIRGTCSVHRVDGGLDGSENLAVQITPKGQKFPTTIDLELDDFPVASPMKDVLNKPAEVEFFIQGVLFKLVVSYQDYGQVACRIHETFAENVKSGVGVIQKPFCTFITVPARRTTANNQPGETMYDFIPPNHPESPKENVDIFIHCIADGLKRSGERGEVFSRISDGTNQYYSRTVVAQKADGSHELSVNNCFRDGVDDAGSKLLFCPTPADVNKAIEVFKFKGYYVYYDRDMGEYVFTKVKKIYGDAVQKASHWL